MFCKNCGTQLPDNAVFCTNCGANNGAAPAAAPVRAASNGNANEKAVEYANSIVDIFKNFFVKGPRYALDDAAGKKNFAWVALAVLSFLICTFSIAINFGEITQFFGFGKVFLNNAITSLISIFVPIGLLWLLFNIIFKINVNFSTIANIYSIATIPVVAAYVLGMLFGLFYVPATLLILLVAVIYSFTLLNYSIEKLFADKKSDIVYVTTVFFTVLFTILTFYLCYKETVMSAFMF